jgi:hypothetical protein
VRRVLEDETVSLRLVDACLLERRQILLLLVQDDVAADLPLDGKLAHGEGAVTVVADPLYTLQPADPLICEPLSWSVSGRPSSSGVRKTPAPVT